MGKNALLIFTLWSTLQAVVTEALYALEDRVLTAFEMLNIIKVGFRNWRAVDIGEFELNRLEIVSNKDELSHLDFKEGDAVLLIPGEILRELKFKLE